jgi:hypothetical protein
MGGKGEGEARSGAGAVNLSKDLNDWKEAGTTGAGGLTRIETTLKKVGDKTFVRIQGVYVDTTYKDGLAELKIKWGSDAYFAALRAVPELGKYLAIGENVIVVIKGKALIVGQEGQEKLTEDEAKAFFAK